VVPGPPFEICAPLIALKKTKSLENLKKTKKNLKKPKKGNT